MLQAFMDLFRSSLDFNILMVCMKLLSSLDSVLKATSPCRHSFSV